MSAIQIVLDEKLIKAANMEAKRQKVNRSVLFRSLLQDHLERRRMAELNERDRRGYEAQPQTHDEIHGWDGIQTWPED